MSDESEYDEWIANRRAAKPSGELVDLVMTAVKKRDVQNIRFVGPAGRLTDRINKSRIARSAACLAALLVGTLPFLCVAYVAHLLVF